MTTSDIIALLSLIVAITFPIGGVIIYKVKKNTRFERVNNREKYLANILDIKSKFNELDKHCTNINNYLEIFHQIFHYDIYLRDKSTIKIPINISKICEISENGGHKSFSLIKEEMNQIYHSKLLTNKELDRSSRYFNKSNTILYSLGEINSLQELYGNGDMFLNDYKSIEKYVLTFFSNVTKANNIIYKRKKKYFIKYASLLHVIEQYKDFTDFNEFLKKEKS